MQALQHHLIDFLCGERGIKTFLEHQIPRSQGLQQLDSMDLAQWTSKQKEGSSYRRFCHMHSGSVSCHCKQCSVWPALLPASASAWNIIHQDITSYNLMPLWLTCLAWESHPHAWAWHTHPASPSKFLRWQAMPNFKSFCKLQLHIVSWHGFGKIHKQAKRRSSYKWFCQMHSGSVSCHCRQCSVWPALLPASASAWNIIHQDTLHLTM